MEAHPHREPDSETRSGSGRATAPAPGSIRELLPLALPIALSQAIDVTMIFCDRYFLSLLGKEQLAASLTGGILSYLLGTLMVGTLGQLAPIIGQYFGAGQRRECTHAMHQGLLLAVSIPPVLLVLSYASAPALFSFFGHEARLYENELNYFRILSLTALTASLRQVFASFFIGIGRSMIVTVASLAAVLINIPLAYGLIFGMWGLPRWEIEGAALATVIASAVPIFILGAAFYSGAVRRAFHTTIPFRWDGALLLRILRYGLPAGMEMLVNVAGFLFFAMVMHSYSSDVAAATTIVLNWDMASFLPVMGVSQAVSSLVGRYLGAHDRASALRSAHSSLKIAWAYAACVTLIYFTFTDTLIGLFAADPGTYAGVIPYARLMLKISCLYFFFDAAYVTFGGILKGSGDTIWTMVVSNSLMWGCALVVFFGKERLGLTPIGGWVILTGLVFLLGVVFGARFLAGRWQDRLMIAAARTTPETL